MRVSINPLILRQSKRNNNMDNIRIENDLKKKLEEIYNSIYEDNFFTILTTSKISFLNRIESKGKEIADIIFNQKNNTNIVDIINKIKIDINLRYTEDYTLLYQSCKNIKNRIGHYNILINFRKHCEKSDECAYHSCINNTFQKLYEIKNSKNEVKYILCPDCKYCFLSNCIRLVCKSCNKEYFSSVLEENQDKNILLATWDKYHCGSMKNQTMKCIKCRKDLYINLSTNKLICLNKACNFSSKPQSILWKCSKCGKDFRSKPKIFNPTELNIIQKAINLTLLLKQKAYPKELPCCKQNPETLTFFHKEECKGVLFLGELINREIVVCSKCHAMNFEEKFTWICPKCNVKFHLHQLISIKPFKVRKYIINRDHSILSKRYNKSNINLRNLKNKVTEEHNMTNLKNDVYFNDICHSVKPEYSYYLNDNNENFEFTINDKGSDKKIFSDNDRSCSNDKNYRNFKRIDSISIDEEKYKKDDVMSDYNKSNGGKKNDYNKIQKKGKHYKTLLDILEKRKQRETMIQSDRQFANSEFSFNEASNNLYDRSSTGISNKEGTRTFTKTSRNNNNNIKHNDSKWQIVSEMNENNNNNEDDNYVYKKKINISTYKKTNPNDKNCRINDFNYQVILLQDNQRRDRNISDNLNLNINKYEEDKITPFINQKNINSYVIDNDSLSKKNVNNSDKTKKPFQFLGLNNSSTNLIENKIYRYNKRNDKKIIINTNINNSNIISLHSDLKQIKNNNRIISEANNIKLGDHQRKLRRNSRVKNDDISKDKTNLNENEVNIPKISENSSNNYLIYQNTKNYFVKFTLRQSTPDKVINKKNEALNKPIKVSRIYLNKMVQKNNNDKNQKENEKKDTNLNDEKDNQKLKSKKSYESFNMKSIIATPDKIKEISRNCIIPDFQDNDYKYIRPIGEGSYGMIYLVKNIKTNKEYALKKILCKNLNEILKHKNQLELIYSMKHENIMKIYYLQFKYLDFTTYSLYIIMERATGDWFLDIRKRVMTKKYYKESEIINILKQVVSALLYLEERKIAHRDIKPQNILIFPGKIYKVADLGEAKNIDSMNREMTLRGSELYMSPLIYQKHKLNKRDLIHNVYKSDVFSLGYSTLYAICLNVNVIEDIREFEDMKKIVNSINKYFNKKLYSEKLYRLIINMVEIDENKRYSFKDIDRELKNW